MKKNNKITPEVHKAIVALAKELPLFYRTDKSGNTVYTRKQRIVKGSELTAEEIAKIKGFDPKKTYSEVIKSPVFVNHEVALIAAYQAKGQEGIDIYTNHCHKLKSNADANAK